MRGRFTAMLQSSYGGVDCFFAFRERSREDLDLRRSAARVFSIVALVEGDLGINHSG